jgi:hypothetical protein
MVNDHIKKTFSYKNRKNLCMIWLFYAHALAYLV